jgi:hypothetical protein
MLIIAYLGALPPYYDWPKGESSTEQWITSFRLPNLGCPTDDVSDFL